MFLSLSLSSLWGGIALGTFNNKNATYVSPAQWGPSVAPYPVVPVAHATYYTKKPYGRIYYKTEVQFPLARHMHQNLDGWWVYDDKVYICIRGQITAWHARAEFLQVDKLVRGIQVVHSCSNAYKVRISVVNKPNVGWDGLESGLNVYFNSAYPVNPRVAAHEFLHVLGMEHHVGPGLLQTPASILNPMSKAELNALRKAYP